MKWHDLKISGPGDHFIKQIKGWIKLNKFQFEELESKNNPKISLVNPIDWDGQTVYEIEIDVTDQIHRAMHADESWRE